MAAAAAGVATVANRGGVADADDIPNSWASLRPPGSALSFASASPAVFSRPFAGPGDFSSTEGGVIGLGLEEPGAAEPFSEGVEAGGLTTVPAVGSATFPRPYRLRSNLDTGGTAFLGRCFSIDGCPSFGWAMSLATRRWKARLPEFPSSSWATGPHPFGASLDDMIGSCLLSLSTYGTSVSSLLPPSSRSRAVRWAIDRGFAKDAEADDAEGADEAGPGSLGVVAAPTLLTPLGWRAGGGGIALRLDSSFSTAAARSRADVATGAVGAVSGEAAAAPAATTVGSFRGDAEYRVDPGATAGDEEEDGNADTEDIAGAGSRGTAPAPAGPGEVTMEAACPRLS